MHVVLIPADPAGKYHRNKFSGIGRGRKHNVIVAIKPAKTGPVKPSLCTRQVVLDEVIRAGFTVTHVLSLSISLLDVTITTVSAECKAQLRKL